CGKKKSSRSDKSETIPESEGSKLEACRSLFGISSLSFRTCFRLRAKDFGVASPAESWSRRAPTGAAVGPDSIWNRGALPGGGGPMERLALVVPAEGRCAFAARRRSGRTRSPGWYEIRGHGQRGSLLRSCHRRAPALPPRSISRGSAWPND